MVTHKNRYGDVFTFEKMENGNIQWSGDFEYCRFGMPNDYSKAWEKFQEDYGGLSYEDFIDSVHSRHDDTGEYVFPELVELVTSIPNAINMVDPSGGPYLAEGMETDWMGVDGKIKEFVMNAEGYEIVVE